MGVLLDLDGAHVLVGELAAHEGAGLLRGADALDPLERGEIEPLVVGPFLWAWTRNAVPLTSRGRSKTNMVRSPSSSTSMTLRRSSRLLSCPRLLRRIMFRLAVKLPKPFWRSRRRSRS